MIPVIPVIPVDSATPATSLLSSIWVIIAFVGVSAILLFVICIALNSVLVRRSANRSERPITRVDHSSRPQGWTESGRRARIGPEDPS